MNNLITCNIQHFSLHDGPGIRTTVFLKGCTLNCAWCHNPESISAGKQLMYNSMLCIGCGECSEVCRFKAHSMANGMHSIDFSLCRACGKCTEVCFSDALELCGREYTTDELYSICIRDEKLYSDDGGVTFSGGEPLRQMEKLLPLIKRLKGSNVSIAVDTALNVPFEKVMLAAEYADMFLVDLKIMNDELHRKYTGASNSLITDNFLKLSRLKPIYIRIPVIGGVNDNISNMLETAELIRKAEIKNIKQINLLSYHDLGLLKALHTGRKMEKFITPSKEKMEELKNVFRSLDIETVVD